MPSLSRGVLLAGPAVVLLALPAVAPAAPVTVDLRIEGRTSTLFEGPVTTDVRPFRFTALDPLDAESDTDPHTCDGTTTGGSSSQPVPTRGAAVMAAVDQGLTIAGRWYDAFGAAFAVVGGESTRFDGSTFEYLVEYENFRSTMLGACADDIQPGDQVLFAYATGSEPLLKLTGPGTVTPGSAATVKVVDGGTSAGIAGAAVGGATTAQDGTATVGPFTERGPQHLKATKAGTIRSNRLTVCVTDGADGFCGTAKPGAPPTTATPSIGPCVTTGDDGLCGTSDRRPPGGGIGSVREQERFAKGRGPRTLSGAATDAQGIAKVRLRLTRTDRRRCTTFDGTRERLVAMHRCGALRGKWIEAGTKGEWSYLLPTRLPRGRYVLDVEATDTRGNADKRLERGRNRIVFHVS